MAHGIQGNPTGKGGPFESQQKQQAGQRNSQAQVIHRRGRAVSCLEAATGHMHEKQESDQHDQNEEHQFGVSGAHGFSLPFPAIAANEVFALPFSVAAKRQSTATLFKYVLS